MGLGRTVKQVCMVNTGLAVHLPTVTSQRVNFVMELKTKLWKWRISEEHCFSPRWWGDLPSAASAAKHHVKILKVRQFVRLFAERLDAEKIFWDGTSPNQKPQKSKNKVWGWGRLHYWYPKKKVLSALEVVTRQLQTFQLWRRPPSHATFPCRLSQSTVSCASSHPLWHD